MHIVGALRIKIGSWGLLITIIVYSTPKHCFGFRVSALTLRHALARFLVRGEQHIGRRSTARLASPQGVGFGGVAAMKPNANSSPASSLFDSSSATHAIPCDRTAPLYGICVTFPAKKRCARTPHSQAYSSFPRCCSTGSIVLWGVKHIGPRRAKNWLVIATCCQSCSQDSFAKFNSDANPKPKCYIVSRQRALWTILTSSHAMAGSRDGASKAQAYPIFKRSRIVQNKRTCPQPPESSRLETETIGEASP